MKKIFTLAAALMLAFSVYAEKIYFQTTKDCDWSADGAKIGAIFRTGMSDQDYGLWTSFFTSEGNGLYSADIPTNEESWVSVQFMRFNPVATEPAWADFWNGTGVEAFDGSKDMFTATSWGEGQLTTTGIWSKYTPGPTPTPTGDKIYFQTTKDCDWSVDGAKIGAIFRTGMSDQDYGLFTAFFTSEGDGLYSAEIPENEEPWVSVQFLRYNPIAEKPAWADFWNGTGVEAYDGTYNLFTATSWGEGQFGTTGTWSVYTPTDAPSVSDEEQSKNQIVCTPKGLFVITANNEVWFMGGTKTNLTVEEIY